MNEEKEKELTAYVDAAARVLQMPLTAQRAASVVSVMTRIAEFALDIVAFELADDVEIAGAVAP